MKKIRIPAPYGELVLSFGEAADLVAELTEAIREHSKPTDGLYLSRYDIKLLLAGTYGDSEDMLDRHVGRLFSAIVRSACYGRIGYDLVCTRCNQQVVDLSGKPGCPHYGVTEAPFGKSIEVSADSLLEHEEAFYSPALNIRGVGDAVRKDMRILISKLPN